MFHPINTVTSIDKMVVVTLFASIGEQVQGFIGYAIKTETILVTLVIILITTRHDAILYFVSASIIIYFVIDNLFFNSLKAFIDISTFLPHVGENWLIIPFLSNISVTLPACV